MEFANKAMNAQVKISELVEVIYLSVRNQKDAPTRDEIGDEILENGISSYLTVVAEFISCAFMGNEEFSKLSREEEVEGN
jgi:hypothetical protein